jgi:hypothetical protein
LSIQSVPDYRSIKRGGTLYYSGSSHTHSVMPLLLMKSKELQ